MRATFTITQANVALSAARPVHVQWVDVAPLVRPHDHEYHEICLVLQGRAVHQTATGSTEVGPGRAIVVPPAAVHGLRAGPGCRAVNVYYLAEWLAVDLAVLWAEPGLVPLFLSRSVLGPTAPADVAEFDLTAAESERILADLRDVEGESTVAACSNVLIRGAFLKVLARLTRAHVRQRPDRPTVPADLWQVASHIEQAAQQGSPLDIATIARHAGLSADYLARRFQQSVGRTMRDFYQLRRVHRACQLLMDPRRTVTDVALDLGYADAPHFCRMFKRHRSMSPSAYRAVYGAPLAG